MKSSDVIQTGSGVLLVDNWDALTGEDMCNILAILDSHQREAARKLLFVKLLFFGLILTGLIAISRC